MQQMSENEKRIQLREDIKKHNSILSGVAKEAGVIEPLDYTIFNNEGYKGLYDGRTAKDIAKKKEICHKIKYWIILVTKNLAQTFLELHKQPQKSKEKTLKINT
jgi:DNA-damage-inducible protein D